MILFLIKSEQKSCQGIGGVTSKKARGYVLVKEEGLNVLQISFIKMDS